MSRPLRIEFPNAFYHVMNRGAAGQTIFERDKHRLSFLSLLEEIHVMFKAEIHAYCLMDNHYHLLLSTPDANLSRIMRHVNGVYTQRYNLWEETDGPLFRGRYKAILVDADNYLLSVSRYIHLNPVEAGIVKKAVHYPWSSYRAYIGCEKTPNWLTTSESLAMTGQRQQKLRYQAFVEQGIDHRTDNFYGSMQVLPILGSETFVENHMKRQGSHQEIPETRRYYRNTKIDDIVRLCAQQFAVPEMVLYDTTRGRGRQNTARSAAIYVSRKYAGFQLNDIAKHFALNHYGSVSGAVSRFARLMGEDQSIKKKVLKVVKIINKQT